MKKLTFFILGVVFSHSLAFSNGCLPWPGMYIVELVTAKSKVRKKLMVE